MSFEDLADLARHHSESKGKHCARYQLVVKQQLARLEGWWKGRPAETLTPSEIEAKLTEHAKTPATFNRYKAALSLAYRVGIADGKVTVNPARNVRQRTENNARFRFLSRLRKRSSAKSSGRIARNMNPSLTWPSTPECAAPSNTA